MQNGKVSFLAPEHLFLYRYSPSDMTFFFILISLFSGILAALAMSISMRLISRLGGGDEVDMVMAIGSFFTGRKENATRFGILIHVGSGIFFGLVYGLIFSAISMTTLPEVFLVGIGLGFLHGLGMAYVLMISMAEKHPLQEFRSVSLLIGVIHLAGHIVFGATVGLLAGLGTAIGQAIGLS